MPDYRIYFLDQQNRIRRALELACEDDHEAAAVLAEHRHAHGLELWQGARKVMTVEAPQAPT